MTDTAPLGFPEAARRLGVPVRVLRRAIRDGRIPSPPRLSATSALPPDWLERALAIAEASPKALHRSFRAKAPAFARYEGTSAWRKYANRVREYSHFRATAEQGERGKGEVIATA